jgi:hypothetical protein
MRDTNDFVIKDPNSPATPQQTAYLKYLKQKIPWGLKKGQASQLIDAAKKAGLTKDNGLWISTRRLLHPELYYEMDVLELYNSMYTHIRENMKGGSQKLTEKKIVTIIDLLDKTQRGWSASTSSYEIFVAKLKDVFPGCCDEKGQDRGKKTQVKPAASQQIVTVKNAMAEKEKNSPAWAIIILVVVVGLIVWVVLRILMG